MPISEIHKKKKVKNYAMLAVIVSLMALFFGVTLVKLKASQNVSVQSEQK